MQRNKVGPVSHARHKTSLEMGRRLKIRPETLRLKENRSRELLDIVFLEFLDPTPAAEATETPIHEHHGFKVKAAAR